MRMRVWGMTFDLDFQLARRSNFVIAPGDRLVRRMATTTQDQSGGDRSTKHKKSSDDLPDG